MATSKKSTNSKLLPTPNELAVSISPTHVQPLTGYDVSRTGMQQAMLDALCHDRDNEIAMVCEVPGVFGSVIRAIKNVVESAEAMIDFGGTYAGGEVIAVSIRGDFMQIVYEIPGDGLFIKNFRRMGDDFVETV